MGHVINMPEKKTTKSNSRRPKKWSSTQSTISAMNEEFPDAKTLLISSKRPKTFLVRTARELLAGGTEVLILSALGDAMPLGVHLQVALESSKAATVIRIETTYNLTSTRNKEGPYTPGLRIFMKKHPEFKGSRISPGYVSFCDSNQLPTPFYDDSFPNDKFCTLVKCNTFKMEEVPEFTKNFQISEIKNFIELFDLLFKEALNIDNEEVKVVNTDSLNINKPNIKFAICRILPKIGKPESIHGTCILVVLKDSFPLNNDKNIAFALTIPPDPSSYDNADDYLEALSDLGDSMMTTLCDYNGYSKREPNKSLSRITVCRIPPFDPAPKLEVTKLDVAKAFLNGLAIGYRHGPSPRLNFSYDDDSYKTAWIETTGLPIYESR